MLISYYFAYILISHLACLHDQNKSGFFGGRAFFQPICAFRKRFRKLWLTGKKPAPQKGHILLFWSCKQANYYGCIWYYKRGFSQRGEWKLTPQIIWN